VSPDSLSSVGVSALRAFCIYAQEFRAYKLPATVRSPIFSRGDVAVKIENAMRRPETNIRQMVSVVLRFAVLAGVSFFGPFAVAHDVDPTSDPNVQPYAGTPVSGYRLAWSDEFNTNAVDTNKWNFRTGVRYWSVQQPQNNAVTNGLYQCLLKKETVGTNQYTAGGIISKKAVRYGYYEARMRVPPGRGWHTSFWMITGGTPVTNTGIELDIIENDSITPLKYGVNTHRWAPSPHVTYGSKSVTTPSLTAGFHVLGCEFTATKIKYFFDGALVQTVDATQFAHCDLNIWLTSIAGPLGGTTNVDDTQLPNVAEFDYARFFTPTAASSVSIIAPSFAGVMLADSNAALRVAALATSSDTNLTPTVAWSKVSGPGSVTFGNATNTDTTAMFSAPGSYVLQCQAVVQSSTNTDQVTVAINSPLSLALRQGVNDYAHVATFIRGDSPGWNSGGRDQFIVGRWGGLGMRPLLSFDLRGIDPTAVIQSAALDLWTDATAGTGAVGALELHKLNSTPVEGAGDGSSAGNGAGTGATWLSRTGGTNASDLWLNAGGDFETNVLSSVAGYDATVTNQQKTFSSTGNFVTAVQSALTNDLPLDLLVISPTTEAGANNYISRMSSDDSLTVTQRPQLVLTFLGNFAPAISPGGPFVALVNLPALLGGSATNADGSSWSKASGPGVVAFTDAANPATAATFSAPGNYVLRLAASNAFAQVSRDMNVTVVASPPQLSSLLLTTNRFQFQITGTTGVTCMIQASTNLILWTNLFATNPAALPFTWSDLGKTNFPRRFYRVQLEP
jgi:beta-glucanase (GH16 family)